MSSIHGSTERALKVLLVGSPLQRRRSTLASIHGSTERALKESISILSVMVICGKLNSRLNRESTESVPRRYRRWPPACFNSRLNRESTERSSVLPCAWRLGRRLQREKGLLGSTGSYDHPVTKADIERARSVLMEDCEIRNIDSLSPQPSPRPLDQDEQREQRQSAAMRRQRHGWRARRNSHSRPRRRSQSGARGVMPATKSKAPPTPSATATGNSSLCC